MNIPSLEEILGLSFDTQTANMYTAIPCTITNIVNSLEDLRVDVRPTINTLYSDGTSEDHSQLLGIPVIFPAGRTSMLSFPLFVGDTVLCVFSQRSMDNFKGGAGAAQAANDDRRFDSRDAIAIPGLVPFSKSLNKPSVRSWEHDTSDFVIAHNIATGSEVELRMKANGDLIINTNQNVEVNCTDATVNCENAQVTAQSNIGMNCATFNLTATSSMNITCPAATWIGNITHTGMVTQTGDYTQTGTYTLNGININLHKHTGVTPGVGTSGGPTN